MDMIKKLVSLEEKRVSTLMISMLFTLAFALFMYWHRGDISANLVGILNSLILGVVGVSAASLAESIWGKEKTPDEDSGNESDV